MRVRVFYHDRCFDGAASAALFARFYRERVRDGAEFVFTGLVHRAGALFVLFIALWILGFILGMIAGPLALIIFPINLLLLFGEIGLCIFMMIKAYGNNKTQLPIIGAMAAKQAGL